jgi:hypothetical protein
VSSTQLTASILAADIATANTFAVTVFDSAPGSGLSNALPITVIAPAGGTYLVGDGFPAGTDAVGGFGDGILNNLDLIYALRAVTKVSGFTPLACSDRFDAMDSFPLDTDTVRGGDGQLNNLDLIRTLRRVTKIDTSLPVRTSRGLTCTAAAQQFALQGRRETEIISAEPASGALEFGEAQPAPNGMRVPVYLRANSDLDLSDLSLSLGIEGAGIEGAAALHFAPAAAAPALLDNTLPGVLAMAWFNGLRVASGQKVLLGYAEVGGTSGAAGSLQIFGSDANAASDGHTVHLSSPAFQETKPRIDTQ